MKKLFIASLMLGFSFCGSAQNQNVEELVKRNGFKDIRLGSPADSVKGLEFEKDYVEFKEFPCRLYSVDHPDYKKVGEANVSKVELKVYNGIIYEIIVTTPKDPRIMRGLEKLYGKPIYSLRTESYYWRATDQLSLVYKGHHKEITLTYKSYPVIKQMYADKQKKIEEIAEDF